MRREKYKGYIAAGVTAFTVIAAALLFFFILFHFQQIRNFFATVFYILRPVFYGVVLAFLLLPIHRHINNFPYAAVPDEQRDSQKVKSSIHFVAIVFSLVFAAAMIYILLAMVIPQVYYSIEGLIDSLPQ